MVEFLQKYQLDLMLVLSGMCAVIALFSAITRTIPKKRKSALIYIETVACFLLISDRYAYIYRGDVSVRGYWMVRITNFMVFMLTLALVHAMNRYISDLCLSEIGINRVPFRIRCVELVVVVGWALVIISQFTNLYYSFDDQNRYQRGPLFLVCYALPFVSLFIQMSVIVQYYKKLEKTIRAPLLLFTVIPMVASFLQVLTYGVSLTNITIVGMAIVLYIFAIEEMNNKVERATRNTMEALERERNRMESAFGETLGAVSETIDSRYEHTEGHSLRVAEYSREIAKAAGMSKNECFEIYCAALLHDLGKLKVPDTVLNKQGGLSESETELFRKHTEYGAHAFAEVDDIPALAAAAAAHHERFDGKGYPKGIRGEAIPVAARIIAVANAYDLMSSSRSNNGPMAQGRIRETFLKGAGKEFDPRFASIMIDLIDKDTEYEMREDEDQVVDKSELYDLNKAVALHFSEYKEIVSDGVKLSPNTVRLKFNWRPDAGVDKDKALPAIVLFDSVDGCVHRDERSIKNNHYFEYAEIWFDGHTIESEARNIVTTIDKREGVTPGEAENRLYNVEIVRVKDHARIKILDEEKIVDVIVALPDTVRFAYLGLTGEHCHAENIEISTDIEAVAEDYIPRIAEEISFINRLEGDMPNVQIDGYRTASSAGTMVFEGMRINFHTMTLPTAGSVLHCAYVLLYSSEDGKVNGKGYHELACIRLDGEDATDGDKSVNELTVHREVTFEGWDAWKKINKMGLDYEVAFKRRRNRVTMSTGNAGITIKCVTTLPQGIEDVYAAITGEQCAITDIRII